MEEKWEKIITGWGKVENVPLLPTRGWESGYAPEDDMRTIKEYTTSISYVVQNLLRRLYYWALVGPSQGPRNVFEVGVLKS